MKHFACLLSLFLVASTSMLAQEVKYYSTTSGNISFQSEAPYELIKAISNHLQGVLDPAKKEFAFKVRMETFEGFNSALQREHFNENYMESKKHPEARFTGKIIEDIDFTRDGTYSVRAKGMFTAHGVSQERIIKSELIIKDGMATVKSNFTVLLSDHNIPIPKVVKDKLSSEINVEVICKMQPRK